MKSRVMKEISLLLCMALLLSVLPLSVVKTSAASVSIISAVTATSNYSEPQYGDEIVSPTFNVTTENVRVVADKSGWQRLNPVTGKWESYDSSWGSISDTEYKGRFRAGTFRYAAWVELTNSTDCTLKHNVTFRVDGETWTAIDALDNETTENYVQLGKNFRAVSEQFVLSDPAGTSVYFHGPQPMTISNNWSQIAISPIELLGYAGGGNGSYRFEKNTVSSTENIWTEIDADGTVSGTPTQGHAGGTMYFSLYSNSGEVNERINVAAVNDNSGVAPITDLKMNFVVPTPILGESVEVADEFVFSGTFSRFVKCPELENGWYKRSDTSNVEWKPYTDSVFDEGWYVYVVALRVSDGHFGICKLTKESNISVNDDSNWDYMDTDGVIRSTPCPYNEVCEDGNVSMIMRLVSDSIYVTDDYNALPDVENVKISEGDILDWDAFPGAAQYKISFGNHEFNVTENMINLRQKAAESGLAAGKAYTVSLCAVNADNEQISKTYIRNNICIGRTADVSIHIFGQTLNKNNRYLIVSGNTVTATNTGVLGANGCVAFFDTENGVLNLKNCNFEGDDGISMETADGLAGDLIIKLHGNNVIRSISAGTTRYAIVNDTGGDIEITSDNNGTLHIEARADSWATVANGGYRAVGIIAGDNKASGAVKISGNASVDILANHTADTTYFYDRYRTGAAGIQSTTGITVKDNAFLTVDARSLCSNHIGGHSAGLINGGNDVRTVQSDIIIDTAGKVEINTAGGPVSGIAAINYNGANRLESTWGMTLWVKNSSGYSYGTYPEFTYPTADYVRENTSIDGKRRTVIKPMAFALNPEFTGSNLSKEQWKDVGEWQIGVTIDKNEFADDLTGQEWIVNLPHGLTQSIVKTGARTATVTVSGIAKEPTRYPVKLKFTFPSNSFAEPIPEAVAESNITYHISSVGERTILHAGTDKNGNGYTWTTDSNNKCTLRLDSYRGKAINIDAELPNGTKCPVTIEFKFTNYIDVYTGTESYGNAGIMVESATEVNFKHLSKGSSINIDGDSDRFRGISAETPVTISSGSIYIHNECSENSSMDNVGIHTLSHPLTIAADAKVDIHMKSDHPQSNGRDWFGIRCGQLNVNGSLNVEVTGTRVSMNGIGIYPSETLASEPSVRFGGTENVHISAPNRYFALSEIIESGSTSDVAALDSSKIAFTYNSGNQWTVQDGVYDVNTSKPSSITGLKSYSFGENVTVIKEYGEAENQNDFKYYYIETPCTKHTNWSDDYECDVCYRRIVMNEQPAQVKAVTPAANASANVQWSLQPLYTEDMFKALPQAEFQIYKNDNTWSEWMPLDMLQSQTGGNVDAAFASGTELTFTQKTKRAENYWLRLRVQRLFTHGKPLLYDTDVFNVSFGKKVSFNANGVPFPVVGNAYSTDVSEIECGTGYSISGIRYYDKVTNLWLSDTAIASQEQQIQIELTPALLPDYSIDRMSVFVNGQAASMDENGNVIWEAGAPVTVWVESSDDTIEGVVDKEITTKVVTYTIKGNGGWVFRTAFNGIKANSWIKNLPAGINVSAGVPADGKTLTLTFSGTPTEAKSDIIRVTILPFYITGGVGTKPDSIPVKSNARFDIRDLGVNIEGDKIIAVNTKSSSVALVAASYDASETLVDMKIISVPSGSIVSKAISGLGLDQTGVTKIKVMLLKDFATMVPLAPPITLEL